MDHNQISVEKKKPDTKGLWKVFWILLGLTALEFLVAFTVDADALKWTKINIFLFLTIVKAYYIVAYFMHLRDEAKFLIWSILLPCIFIIWFIGALLVEGNYFGIERFW